jgi:protein O-GlcNAcase / histone acetyltransferase
VLEYSLDIIILQFLSKNIRNIILLDFMEIVDDPVTADIKLEIETEDGAAEEVPTTLSPLMYHPRRALRNAVIEWLLEFKKPRPAWGPIEPKPVLITTSTVCTTMAPSVPASFPATVNTCISVTTTTTSSTTGCISAPMSTVGSHLDTLADVCAFVSSKSLFIILIMLISIEARCFEL